MSRRYWSREPSSYEIFLLLLVLAIEPGTPCCDEGCPMTLGASAYEGAVARSMHTFSESLPANSGEPGEAMRRVRSVAEINEQRLPADKRVRHETPIAAIG